MTALIARQSAPSIMMADGAAGKIAPLFFHAKTLIAASWPPTSGAPRTSGVRTTPKTGGAGVGRHRTYPPARRDHEDAERDDAYGPAASRAPASA
jgi:hypothetical protein